MKFSIIVPIYNVEKFLVQCIESVLAQDFQDFELILVDDGSPDNCAIICDEYEKKDSRIKVIHKENGGLVSARKAGANIAKGEYILNLDGDDWILSNYLSEISKAIEKSGKADVIAWGHTIKSDTEEREVNHKLPEGLYSGDKLDCLREIYLYDKYKKGIICDSIVITITKAVKNELYLRCQELVNNKITKGEDAMMGWHLLLNCNSFYILKNCGYIYRTVETSMSRKFDMKDFKILSLLILNMKDVVPKKYLNQVKCYTFHRLMDLFTLVSREYKYKEFKEIINENLDKELLSFSLSGKIYHKRIKEFAKKTLLKFGLWRILYTILRNY